MRKKNNKLIIPALYGGKKIINYRFKPYNTLGKEEISAATNVIKTGKLSQFKAAKSRNFFGGFYVRKFEDNLKKFYNVKYAITFNSWTSGLIASLGALDLEPGDEVITTPGQCRHVLQLFCTGMQFLFLQIFHLIIFV